MKKPLGDALPSYVNIENDISKYVDDMRAWLLDWYDTQGRSLPWRIRPEDRAKGAVPDPYAVWLSEVMSQQTTIAHAAPYWQRFLQTFPTVEDLANAERDMVLAMWAGLGYYARARNLHKCAIMVKDEYGGVFPKDEAGLLKLPGIGPYTAATIAAICYEEACNIVDGNVERVISRIFAVEAELPAAKPDIRARAGLLVKEGRCGDYGQALMDLGSTVCTPKSPKCTICPWQSVCAGRRGGNPQAYPKKRPKQKLPVRWGAVFVLSHEDAVLLERRADKGLLGGMMGFPGTPWEERAQQVSPSGFANDVANDIATDIMAAAPQNRNWQKAEQPVRHVFTHFELYLTVYSARTDNRNIRGNINAVWASRDGIERYALPTVFKKVLTAA